MTWEIYALIYLALGTVVGLMGDMGSRYIYGKNLNVAPFLAIVVIWPVIIFNGIFLNPNDKAGP